MENYYNMNDEEIKSLCRSLYLDCKGPRQQLIERIINYTQWANITNMTRYDRLSYINSKIDQSIVPEINQETLDGIMRFLNLTQYTQSKENLLEVWKALNGDGMLEAQNENDDLVFKALFRRYGAITINTTRGKILKSDEVEPLLEDRNTLLKIVEDIRRKYLFLDFTLSHLLIILSSLERLTGLGSEQLLDTGDQGICRSKKDLYRLIALIYATSVGYKPPSKFDRGLCPRISEDALVELQNRQSDFYRSLRYGDRFNFTPYSIRVAHRRRFNPRNIPALPPTVDNE